MSQLNNKIADIWNRVQRGLFPALEEAGLEMTEKLYQLVTLLEVIRIEQYVSGPSPYQVGAKPADRRCLARAFVAQAFYNATDRQAFRDRLRGDHSLRKICGWRLRRDVPSNSTFCRAFQYFAETGLTDTVHETLTRDFLGGDAVALNASTDSTAIAGREKPVTRAKPKAEVTDAMPPKGKKGRPKKGTPSTPKEPTRLERQLTQEPEIALLELPTRCDVGGKTNSKGNKEYWVGYKFHVRVDERCIPLAAVTTAASVHDSQVAIPLMKISDRRVRSLYELMDRGYDAEPIRRAAEEAGHVPIIDRVKRRGQERAPEMEPDRAEHYKGRTVVERFNARLKDEFGGKMIRVRGHRKVHAHLMFGLLVIFADQLMRLGP